MVVDRADELVCDCTERCRDAYWEETEREENISQQVFCGCCGKPLYFSKFRSLSLNGASVWKSMLKKVASRHAVSSMLCLLYES